MRDGLGSNLSYDLFSFDLTPALNIFFLLFFWSWKFQSQSKLYNLYSIIRNHSDVSELLCASVVPSSRLSQNYFSGDIPQWLWTLPNLTRL